MRTVNVSLDNHFAYITAAGKRTYEQLRDYWSFYPPGYRYAPAFKAWQRNRLLARADGDSDRYIEGWDGRIRLFKADGSLPAGLFRATFEELEQELGLHFEIEYNLPRGLKTRIDAAILSTDEKYRYQDDCVEAMVRSIRKGGGIVLAATGTGKTATTAKFFKRVNLNHIFIVDQLDLLLQSQKELAQWLGEPVGIVGKSKYEVQRVTVATIQTLNLHAKDADFREWYSLVDIMVVDELHEQMAKRNFKVLEAVKPLACFGLTATLQLTQKPVRFKAWSFCGPVIFEYSYQRAVKQKVVAEGQVLQLQFKPAWREEDYYRGDYPEEYRAEILEHRSKSKACKKIVALLYERGFHTLLHSERVEHVKSLSDTLSKIPHRKAYGAIDSSKRQAARKKFESGDLRLIIANKVYRKGVNLKIVDAMVDVSEANSKNGVQQKFGRGSRIREGKKEFLHIDFGTQGPGRYGKRSRRRARAFRALGAKVKVVKVRNSAEAVKAVQKFLEGSKCQPVQLKLEM